MMISNVKGRFTGLSGTLTEHLVDSALSSVEATVDVSTISTGDPQRDGSPQERRLLRRREVSRR